MINKQKQLIDLAKIAALLRDTELQKLAEASQPCVITRQRIAALSKVDCGTQPDIPATQIAEKHDQWRFQRRVELNRILARQTAAYLLQHEIAAQAFGRAATLERLGKK